MAITLIDPYIDPVTGNRKKRKGVTNVAGVDPQAKAVRPITPTPQTTNDLDLRMLGKPNPQPPNVKPRSPLAREEVTATADRVAATPNVDLRGPNPAMDASPFAKPTQAAAPTYRPKTPYDEEISPQNYNLRNMASENPVVTTQSTVNEPPSRWDRFTKRVADNARVFKNAVNTVRNTAQGTDRFAITAAENDPTSYTYTSEGVMGPPDPGRRTVKMSPSGMRQISDMSDQYKKEYLMENTPDYTPTFDVNTRTPGQINLRDPQYGFGFATDRNGIYGNLDQYSPQTISRLANQRRAELNARRMAGGAGAGGDILRQVNQLNRKANQMEQELIAGGMNTKGAKRMSQGLRDQADQLLAYDKNLIDRQGNMIDADQNQVARERIAADAAYRDQLVRQGYSEIQADAIMADNQRFDSYLDNLTTYLNEETGSYEKNPAQRARIEDMLGNYRGSDRRRVARDLLAADSYLQGINEKFGGTGITFNDLGEVFDLQEGAKNVTVRGGKLRDLANAMGYDLEDFISELLPFGESGDVYEGVKNGRNVTIGAEDLEEIGLTPRVRRLLFGN